MAVLALPPRWGKGWDGGESGVATFGTQMAPRPTADLRPSSAATPPTLPFPHRGGRVPGAAVRLGRGGSGRGDGEGQPAGHHGEAPERGDQAEPAHAAEGHQVERDRKGDAPDQE